MRIYDVMLPTREERAWAAGFFDGEGHIRSQHRVIQASVNQVYENVEVLERFWSVVDVGKIYGPYHDGNPRHRPQCDHTTARFDEVQYLVSVLWPWLGAAKREQARASLTAFRTYWRPKGYRRTGQQYLLCMRAHPLDEENTYVSPSGKRTCRTCRLNGQRDRRKEVVP